MKVLWFTNTPAGGAEILDGFGVRGSWVASLDKAMRGKVELYVAFYYARFAEPFIHRGVNYIPICQKNWKLNVIRQSLLNDFIDREDLGRYLEIINNVRPDIIHIHGSENSFGCILEAVTIPVVLSIQGNYTVYSHKYFSGIEKRYSSIRERNLSSAHYWLFDKSYKRIYIKSFIPGLKREQKYLSLCRHIIGRTDWDRRITSILSPQRKYYHVDEVLRDSFYSSEWKRLRNRRIVVHSTIGDAFFKGFETLCQSLSELNRMQTDVEWRVAGISENSDIVRIVKRIMKNDYPESGLILLGNLEEKELTRKMMEADIYVMPSHIENSPNSLCEAMILGLPCITTLAGGSSSLLKDKEEGLVIQDGDPWSMAGAVLEMYNYPEIADNYGQNARRRALVRHNPERIANELLATYDLIIKSNS